MLNIRCIARDQNFIAASGIGRATHHQRYEQDSGNSRHNDLASCGWQPSYTGVAPSYVTTLTNAESLMILYEALSILSAPLI